MGPSRVRLTLGRRRAPSPQHLSRRRRGRPAPFSSPPLGAVAARTQPPLRLSPVSSLPPPPSLSFPLSFPRPVSLISYNIQQCVRYSLHLFTRHSPPFLSYLGQSPLPFSSDDCHCCCPCVLDCKIGSLSLNLVPLCGRAAQGEDEEAGTRANGSLRTARPLLACRLGDRRAANLVHEAIWPRGSKRSSGALQNLRPTSPQASVLRDEDSHLNTDFASVAPITRRLETCTQTSTRSIGDTTRRGLLLSPWRSPSSHARAVVL